MTKFKFEKSRGYSFTIIKCETIYGIPFENALSITQSEISRLTKLLRKSLSKDIKIEKIDKRVTSEIIEPIDITWTYYKLKITRPEDFAFFIILANDGIEI
jgi:hypothetical protein